MEAGGHGRGNVDALQVGTFGQLVSVISINESMIQWLRIMFYMILHKLMHNKAVWRILIFYSR